MKRAAVERHGGPASGVSGVVAGRLWSGSQPACWRGGLGQPVEMAQTPIAPLATSSGSVTLATVFELFTGMVCENR
jgi:hypothetical protein